MKIKTMYPLLAKSYFVGQVLLSAYIIFAGCLGCVRHLLRADIPTALLFALLAYLCGYRFLLRASLADLRRYARRRRTAPPHPSE